MAGQVYVVRPRSCLFRHVRLLVSASVVVACACGLACRSQTPPKPPPETQPEATAGPYADLVASIDPGPQPPLVTAAPDWVIKIARPGLQLDDPAKLDAYATSLLEAWQGRDHASPLMQVDAFAGLLAAIAAGETLLARDELPSAELLGLLERAYGIFDVPELNRPNSFLRQIFSTMMTVAAQAKVLSEQQQVAQGVEFFDRLLSQAPVNRRRVAALLLRHYPESEAATVALQGVADDFAQARDYKKSLQLHQQVVEKLGTQATFAHWSRYTRACLAALDGACADRALSQTQAQPVPENRAAKRRDKLDNLVKQRGHLTEYQGLTPGTLDQDVRRAELLLLLGRDDLAGEILKTLQQQQSQDARVWVLAGQYELSHNLDFTAAAKAIDRARPLTPHNETYYEVALGTIVGVFMGDVVPQLARDPDAAKPLVMRVLDTALQDVAGYAKFHPDRAAILTEVITRARSEIPKGDQKDDRWGRQLIEKILAPADDLLTKFPESAEVQRFAILAARFSGQKPRARAEVRRKLPAQVGERENLLHTQQKTGLDLAIIWQDPNILAEVVDMVQTREPPQTPAELLAYADTLALAVLKLDQAALASRAIEAYNRVLDLGKTELRLVALNNLAVLLAHTGDTATAKKHFETAAGHFPGKAAVPLINLATLARPSEQVGLLLGVSNNGPSVQAEKLAWSRVLQRLAPGSSEQRQVQARLDELAAKGKGLLPREVDGSWGALLSGTFDLGLSYSLSKRLELNLKVDSYVWFVLPDPNSK